MLQKILKQLIGVDDCQFVFGTEKLIESIMRQLQERYTKKKQKEKSILFLWICKRCVIKYFT